MAGRLVLSREKQEHTNNRFTLHYYQQSEVEGQRSSATISTLEGWETPRPDKFFVGPLLCIADVCLKQADNCRISFCE